MPISYLPWPLYSVSRLRKYGGYRIDGEHAPISDAVICGLEDNEDHGHIIGRPAAQRRIGSIIPALSDCIASGYQALLYLSMSYPVNTAF
jgi:hypothetical protein